MTFIANNDRLQRRKAEGKILHATEKGNVAGLQNKMEQSLLNVDDVVKDKDRNGGTVEGGKGYQSPSQGARNQQLCGDTWSGGIEKAHGGPLLDGSSVRDYLPATTRRL